MIAMFLVTFILNTTHKEIVLGRAAYRTTMVFAVIVFLPIFIGAAMRGNIGDTWAYKNAFKQLPSTVSGLITYLPKIQKDPGFTVLGGIIKLFIGYRPQVYLAIIAAFQSTCLACVFRKYSSNYLLSIFFFVASTDYLSWMFNGMRQFIAVTIIFAATSFMVRKKWLPALAFILLASRSISRH